MHKQSVLLSSTGISLPPSISILQQKQQQKKSVLLCEWRERCTMFVKEHAPAERAVVEHGWFVAAFNLNPAAANSTCVESCVLCHVAGCQITSQLRCCQALVFPRCPWFAATAAWLHVDVDCCSGTHTNEQSPWFFRAACSQRSQQQLNMLARCHNNGYHSAQASGQTRLTVIVHAAGLQRAKQENSIFQQCINNRISRYDSTQSNRDSPCIVHSACLQRSQQQLPNKIGRHAAHTHAQTAAHHITAHTAAS
jgi:hypothetical protein